VKRRVGGPHWRSNDPSELFFISSGMEPDWSSTTRVQRRLVHLVYLVYLVCLVDLTGNSSGRTRQSSQPDRQTRARCGSIGNHQASLSFSSLIPLPLYWRGVARWSSTARVERGPSQGARSGSTGAMRVSCRSFFFPLFLPVLKGAVKVALDCAHRTSTVSSCAFCEQGGHLAAPSPPLTPVLPPPYNVDS
jgi:hypothetical protein